MFPTIWLSPTTLNMVGECSRCMWDHVLWKQKRPQGPFPSLPRGVDEAMKGYCDRYRPSLPPALKALSEQNPELKDFNLHPDQRWMNSLRDWKGGLVANIKLDGQAYRISGSVDDLLINSDGAFAQLDGKSKAKKPEPGEGEKYYGRQMDTYDLIFKHNGFDVTGLSFLWYVCPVSFEDRDPAIPSANIVFDMSIQVVKSDHNRAMQQIQNVHEMLMKHPDRTKPPASGNCEYCNFAGR